MKEKEETLQPEGIKAWRRIIMMQLEERFEGSGIYALMMPEADVIAYWRQMKAVLEAAPPKVEQSTKKKIKAPCDHSNSFTGSKGKYCIDCEKYV